MRPTTKIREAALRELAEARAAFQKEVAAKPCPQVVSRTAVVLSGGGARGAYEAGALLALQDAQVPTHILAATSVGSINAADYAAHSETLVGNAEPLVEGWSQISSPAMGIDWSRYVFMLAGLIAASAGAGNFVREWMEEKDLFIHMNNPLITWLALMLAGLMFLFLFDKISYAFYVAANAIRGEKWVPDRRKAWISLFANVVVWGFVLLVLSTTHFHLARNNVVEFDSNASLVVLALIPVGWLVWKVVRPWVSGASHKFLRLPFRTGLFPNFERTKYLRRRIPEEGVRKSPMRLLLTATDLESGAGRFFTNTPAEVLKKDPDAEAWFIDGETQEAKDLVQAAVASSAFTLAYEAVPMEGRLWTDGGIVMNQPIRPAVRLGADLLFLVMVDPIAEDAQPSTPEIKTFLDVGVQATAILISKNLKTDLKALDRVNKLCETYAAELGVRPEQVQLEVGANSFRYVKAFPVCPSKPLAATALDFDGEITTPMIVQGYKDATAAVRQFFEYEAKRPASHSRQKVRLSAERLEGNYRTQEAGGRK
jgi:predicted acylesterase/phospholipase RssA